MTWQGWPRKPQLKTTRGDLIRLMVPRIRRPTLLAIFSELTHRPLVTNVYPVSLP